MQGKRAPILKSLLVGDCPQSNGFRIYFAIQTPSVRLCQLAGIRTMTKSTVTNVSRFSKRMRLGTMLCLLAASAATGCQGTVGGQTLPSAYYLRDDIQFFPAGPESLLTNQERALEEYRLQRQTLQQGNVSE